MEEEKKVETIEPVVSPEQEPKKKGKGGLILIGVLLVVLAGVCVWYFVLGGNGSKKDEKEAHSQGEKQEDQNKIKEFELDEEEADKLVSYVPEARPYDREKEYSAFDSKKVTTSEMDNNWLVYRAMQDVTKKGECTTEQFNKNGICDFTLSLDDVKQSVKNLYGDVKIDYPNKVEDNFLWHCTLDNTVYACSNSGGGYAVNEATEYFKLYGNTRTFTKLQKAEKDNNNLYIYVKYGKVEFVYDESIVNVQPGDLTFRVRKYGTGDEVIDETVLSGADFYEENASLTFYEKLYNQFNDKMTTYKITFKIDNNKYHLVSVEPEK